MQYRLNGVLRRGVSALWVGLLVAAVAGCKKPVTPTGTPPVAVAKPAPKIPMPAPGHMIALPPIPIVPIGEPVEGDNQIQNGGFEAFQVSAPVGWTLSLPHAGTVAQSVEYHTQGHYALRVDLPAGGRFEATQTLPVVPRKTYIFRAMVLTKNAPGRARIEVRDPNGKAKPFPVQSPGVTGTSDMWSLQSVRFTVGPFTKKLVVALVYTPGAHAGKNARLWFDQCELYQLNPTNYIVHGGFEDADAQGRVATWWPNDPKRIGMSNDAYEGRHAKAIEPAGNQTNDLITSPPKAAELLGKTIRLRAMVKATSKSPSGPAPATMTLRYLVGGRQHTMTAKHPGNGRWEELTLQDTVPKNANPSSKSFQVVFRREPDAVGPVLVDGVILEVVNKPQT